MKLSAVAIVLIGLSFSQTALAQGPSPRPGPATPVEVQNTAANPVQVTGTLEVTATTPLPVVSINADESVLNAFQERVSFGSGNPDSDKEFIVPTGKRLVIESISAEANLAADQRPQIFLGITFQGKFSVHYVPVTFAGRDPGTLPRDHYQGLHPTRWFADGGTTVEVVCRHIAIGGVNTCGLDMSVSGYFVTMP